jgi:carbamate kinase
MPNPRNKLVVALGGSAISAPGKIGTLEEQFAQISETAEILCDAVQRGYQLIITHDNGPQIGSNSRHFGLAQSGLETRPLDVCVADTQASMGYMIAQCLSNAMGKRHLTLDVTAVLTTVLVNNDDPALQEATKAIGPILTAEQAEAYRANEGWLIRDEADGTFRRVVPSPLPRRIIEMPAIERLVDAGQIVVCCGGGGIPVSCNAQGIIRGAEAVIDKDYTTGLLARHLEAPLLVILTSVEYACLNYGQPDEQRLVEIGAAEAEAYLNEGQFGIGSMRPKIEAAIDFVRHSPHADAVAIIAHVNRFSNALDGTSGTRIVR